jgi:hypothetical protein
VWQKELFSITDTPVMINYFYIFTWNQDLFTEISCNFFCLAFRCSWTIPSFLLYIFYYLQWIKPGQTPNYIALYFAPCHQAVTWILNTNVYGCIYILMYLTTQITKWTGSQTFNLKEWNHNLVCHNIVTADSHLLGCDIVSMGQ